MADDVDTADGHQLRRGQPGTEPGRHHHPRRGPTGRRLRRRYRELAARVGQLGFISPGSLIRRHTSCGKPGCRCQADPPQPHGPYWQWTRKIVGKTIATRLSAAEAAHYAEWINNQRELRRLMAEMEQISRQAAEFILKQHKADTST